MIELKISALDFCELANTLRGLAGVMTPEASSPVEAVRDALDRTAGECAAAAQIDPAPAAPPSEDMRPVRGENAKTIAAAIVVGALPTSHIARLPKALQEEVTAALAAKPAEPVAEEPELPLIRTSPENREPPVEAVVAEPEPAPAAPRKPWEKDSYEVGDVRAALTAYAEKFGMPAAMENGPTMIGAAKVSDLKPEQFGPAVAAIMAEIEAA